MNNHQHERFRNRLSTENGAQTARQWFRLAGNQLLSPSAASRSPCVKLYPEHLTAIELSESPDSDDGIPPQPDLS